MSQSCLFCRMIDRQAPARVLHEDDRVLVIQDINPQAPLHCLVIPKKHIPTLNDLAPEDDALIGEMFRRAAEMAKARGFEGLGYRTVFNCNRQAGQSVYHIHLHVLGGRPFGWPPG